MNTTTQTVAQPAGFVGLLARYISGEISEDIWGHITAILDDAELSSDEREAVAFYLNEFLARAEQTSDAEWNREPVVGEWGMPAHG